MAATITIPTQYESSLHKSCSANIAPPYTNNWTRTTSAGLSNSSPGNALALDSATRTHLLQLYKTYEPVDDPKQIQSHFTCLYLTRSNIDEVLSQRTKVSSLYSHGHSYSFTDLSRLILQSWRVTFGTLDYLELIWTGKRPSKSWSDILTICSECQDGEGNSSLCPLITDDDEYLALNLAITYYYSSEGQPTLSLSAIATTKAAVDVIASHARSMGHEPFPNNSNLRHDKKYLPDSGLMSATTYHAPNLAFDRIPLVNRSLLVPTLCRWRNADVQTTLNMAAEGVAWSGKLRHSEEQSKSSQRMDLDGETPATTDLNQAWFFPTIKIDEPQPTPSTSQKGTSEIEITPTQKQPSYKPELRVNTFRPDRQNYESGPNQIDSLRHTRIERPPPIYELRAALVPGRDIVFRTVASRLSCVIDEEWIRRSSQLDCNGSNRARGAGRRKRGIH